MKKSTPSSILLLTLISALSLNDVVSDGPREVESWFKTLSHEKPAEKMTKMHFYFHDLTRAKNVTATTMALSNVSYPTNFGIFAIADDPVTVGSGLMSKRVGYLKGFYGMTSIEEVGLMMAMTFVFTDEIYNGSSVSVLGYNRHLHLYREVPVVGGSGQFRLAQGVTTLQTKFFNQTTGNFTIEVNMVVFHY